MDNRDSITNMSIHTLWKQVYRNITYSPKTKSYKEIRQNVFGLLYKLLTLEKIFSYYIFRLVFH